MSNLRSKFKKKKAKISDLKKKQDEENQLIGSRAGGEQLSFEDGKTCKFRICPPKDEDFYILRRMCWVTIEDEEGDKVRRTVPNSKLHGGTKKDLIDEYISYVQNNVKDKEKLTALKDWKNGLSYDNEWVAYAVKIDGDKRQFGILPFKKTVRDALNKEMFVEDNDDPIDVDPFTDPDEGLPIRVKYNSKPNKKKGEDYYEVTLAKKPIELTDDELEKLEKAKSLEELFRNNYDMEDFERALDGCRIFDEENEIDAFEEDEWNEIVDEVKKEVASINGNGKPDLPFDKEEENETEADDKDDEDEEDEETAEEEKTEEDEEEGDELDEMDRKELKAYIKENGFELKVKKSMSDEDIREGIRLEAEEEDDDDEEEKTEPAETDEEEGDEESGQTSIEDIRARLAKKAKK